MLLPSGFRSRNAGRFFLRPVGMIPSWRFTLRACWSRATRLTASSNDLQETSRNLNPLRVEPFRGKFSKIYFQKDYTRTRASGPHCCRNCPQKLLLHFACSGPLRTKPIRPNISPPLHREIELEDLKSCLNSVREEWAKYTWRATLASRGTLRSRCFLPYSRRTKNGC